MASNESGSRTAIIVAFIGLFGVVSAALIEKWDGVPTNQSSPNAETVQSLPSPVSVESSSSETSPSPTNSTPTPNVGSDVSPDFTNGNSVSGSEFASWVIGASQGLISDAYVRDENTLGVVITSAVAPDEVRDLTRSLVQGFGKSFPDRDLKVLMFAPDKSPILTAEYTIATTEISYIVPDL